MSTPVTRLYRRASLPQRLHVAALAGYVAVFVALVAYGKPGIGLGQGFYVPIVLAALAGGPATGAAAGILATLLYEIALFPNDGITARAGVHLLWYAAAGAIVGYFAGRGRAMLAEALNALEDLLHLTRRDLETGARSADGLHGVIAERIAHDAPFGVLVGELEHSSEDGDAEFRALMGTILEGIDECTEIARIGATQLAVVLSSTSPARVKGESATLERLIDEHGRNATFGWATYPDDGGDALALLQCARERLYARRGVA